MNVEIHVFGKEDSVKETHQGFLSRSIPARRRRSLRGRLRTKKGRHADACLPFLVPVTGLEPVRHRWRWILSPLRLPFHHTGMN